MAGVWWSESETGEEASSDEGVCDGSALQKDIMMHDEIIFIFIYILGLFKIVSNWIF